MRCRAARVRTWTRRSSPTGRPSSSWTTLSARKARLCQVSHVTHGTASPSDSCCVSLQGRVNSFDAKQTDTRITLHKLVHCTLHAEHVPVVPIHVYDGHANLCNVKSTGFCGRSLVLSELSGFRICRFSGLQAATGSCICHATHHSRFTRGHTGLSCRPLDSHGHMSTDSTPQQQCTSMSELIDRTTCSNA